jgi:hypothetical protein
MTSDRVVSSFSETKQNSGIVANIYRNVHIFLLFAYDLFNDKELGHGIRYSIQSMSWKSRCSIPGRGRRFLSSPKTSKPALKSTHLPTPWVLGVKRPRRKVNHSPPSSAAARNEWSRTRAPPLCLHGVGEDNFTLILLFNDAVGSSE